MMPISESGYGFLPIIIKVWVLHAQVAPWQTSLEYSNNLLPWILRLGSSYGYLSLHWKKIVLVIILSIFVGERLFFKISTWPTLI